MKPASNQPKWSGNAMRILDKKLFRDIRRLSAQALAIALVMACGVATIVISVGAYRSLEETRSAFYDRYRFGSVFASANRAPLYLRSQVEEITGVSSAEFRIVRPVLLEVLGMREPASGIAISVPDLHEPAVNQLYLRRGRLPEPGRTTEIAVLESFAKAHDLQPGDTFEAIMNGKKQALTIVGIVLSPEYIYAIGPGDMVPDPRRFGVFYMRRKTLAGLFDMDGAFNSVSLATLRDTDTRQIITRLDDLLEPYGGTGAHDRDDQISHAFLDAELEQLQGMAKVIPPIFLLVAAFLVNMILSRLIALEREQIGLFKALGYSNWTIGSHYAKLVVLIALVGLIIGSLAGFWLGRGLTQLYAHFFSFPFLIFRQSLDLYAIAGGVTVASALAGAAKAIWTIVGLPPAVAMRPPAPTVYRSFFLGYIQKLGLFSQLTIMAFRHLLRWPVRSFLTTLGTALSVALLITSLFTYDSIDHMVDTVFFRADRQDATLTFGEDQAPDALHAIMALPGVLAAEPFRTTSVKLRNGHRDLRMSIMAIGSGTELARILDQDLNPMPPTPRGLILSERVAEKLRLRPGDPVDVELLETGRRVATYPVSGISIDNPDLARTGANLTAAFPGPAAAVSGLAQSFVGLTAFMHLDALDRLMRDGRRISGARISIDANQLDDLYDAIKDMPVIASIALQDVSRTRFRETIEENISISASVYIALAVIITFGVVYNSARIQLSERARELASLRVFGFTRIEVSSVLMTELGIIVILAQPLGWVLGFGFAWSVIQAFQSDLFRIPLVVASSTFATASMIVLAAAIASALIVRRRIDRLDLIRVLKTRE